MSVANVLTTGSRSAGGKTYYEYEILTRTADGDEGGRHHLFSTTVANGKLYILKMQAGDKRWFKGLEREVATRDPFARCLFCLAFASPHLTPPAAQEGGRVVLRRLSAFRSIDEVQSLLFRLRSHFRVVRASYTSELRARHRMSGSCTLRTRVARRVQQSFSVA